MPLPTKVDTEWPDVVYAGWLNGIRIYVAATNPYFAATQISSLDRDLRAKSSRPSDILERRVTHDQTFNDTLGCFILGEGARKYAMTA